MYQDKKIISLTRDFIFATIFNNEDNIYLLEIILSIYFKVDLEILKGKIKLLSRRQGKKTKREANTEVDVLMELENKDKVVIEMNANAFYDNIKKQNTVYLSKVLSGEYKVGDKKLSNIHNVVQINFNVNPTLFDGKELKKLINEFELREKDYGEIIYSDIIKIVVINMEKVYDRSYNYLNEREEKMAYLSKMLMAKTIGEIKREGEKIMDEKSLDKLTKQIEELNSDEEIIELEGICSKQELSHMEELSKQELAHKEELSKQELAYKSELKEKQTSIIKNMLAKGLTNKEIENLTCITISEQEELLKEDN